MTTIILWDETGPREPRLTVYNSPAGIGSARADWHPSPFAPSARIAGPDASGRLPKTAAGVSNGPGGLS